MPTTTNNGWTTPADTDLVKNGAAAIRTLGNAIDTTLGVYSSPGLSLISTTSFSAVSSQAITAFSSTYQNYRIIVNINSTSGDAILYFGLGNSGTRDTSANIQYAYWQRTNGGSDVSTQGANQSTLYIADLETFSGSRITNVAIDIFNPFIASETGGTVHTSSVLTTGTPYAGMGAFIKGGNTSWSQLFLHTSANNITGSVSVYGYK